MDLRYSKNLSQKCKIYSIACIFQTFGSALQSLQQRTWLIHWSLFVFFNHAKGRDLIIDMFLYSQLYLNAIQTICPHILRYLTTAVITNKSRRRTVLKDLVKVIQQVCIMCSVSILTLLLLCCSGGTWWEINKRELYCILALT